MWSINSHHPLRRMFAGIAEHTFLDRLGIGDPFLIDYLSGMLSRFIHMDGIFRLASAEGRRLEEVAEMVLEAESMPPSGRTRREVHRHIGDITLFWTGVYPESIKRLRNVLNKDHFINYCEQGKKSYYIASTYDDDAFKEEAPVLRRLSDEYELCAYGLREVRREWETLKPDPGKPIVIE